MGKPSDLKRNRRRSAQRPGRRERARVKKHHREEFWGFVDGAGNFHVKAGRKKMAEFQRSKRNPYGFTRLAKVDHDVIYPS